MSIPKLFAVGILVLTIGGCASPPRAAYVRGRGWKKLGFSSHILGYVGEKNNEYAFVDLSKVSISGQSLKAAVLDPLNSVIQTEHIIKLNVTQVPSAYNVLFGPRPGSDDTAVGWMTNATFFVGVGWIYICGTGVAGGTNWAEAGAEGSELLIQTDTTVTQETHRFYFISGTQLHVETNTADTITLERADVGKYVEVTKDPITGNTVINGPLDLPGIGDPVRDFYDTVMSIVAAAGLP